MAERGYNCKLVSPAPESLQTHCPVCLQILREPCLIECPCSRRICLRCISPIKSGKPCPVCNRTKNFNYVMDHGLARELAALEVWCSHRADGCMWRGKLEDFLAHVNEFFEFENFRDGCPYRVIDCSLSICCKICLPRKDMLQHVDDTEAHFRALAVQEQRVAKLKKEAEETAARHGRDINELERNLGHVPFNLDIELEEEVGVFFSRKRGYRLGLRVVIQDQMLIVKTSIMRGSYDEELTWPVRGEIKTLILNQSSDDHHIDCNIVYSNDTPNSAACRQYSDDDESDEWDTIPNLGTEDLTSNSQRQTLYVKDDSVLIRVIKITL